VKLRDTSKFRDRLDNPEDREYSETHAKIRCKSCLNWVKDWQWDDHCVAHEADDFRLRFPKRLHSELRVCLYCMFVTDSDGGMTDHLRSCHKVASTTPSEVCGKKLDRVKPYLDLATGTSIRLQQDPASDLTKENIARRSPTLDATRDYGYPRREGGHYGSHSSHDDFSDDSGPDGK
jgi:hypothetical protein